ncbi:hypothetical protein [Enterovibrio calviensis]|uniref:hypothetical protein n=1 Tax=Enterovibrio calviensis TaxID=91359 RepID=UPI003736DD16
MTDFEQRLIDVIDELDLSPSQISRDIDVGRAAVGKWAKTGKISVESLIQFTTFYNLNPEFILLGKRDISDKQQQCIEIIKSLESDDMRLDIILKILSD